MRGLKMLMGVVILAALVSLAGGQWIEDTLVLPDTMGSVTTPGPLVVNPLTGRVYVPGYKGVLALGPVSRERERFFRDCDAVEFCSGAAKLYLAGDSVAVVDARADTLLRRIAVPSLPTLLVCSQTSYKLYAAMPESDYVVVAVIDTRGDSLLTIIRGWPTIGAMFWDPVLDRIYVHDYRLGGLSAIDCRNDLVVGTLPLVGHQMALNTTDSKLYGSDFNDSLVVIRTDSFQLAGSIPAAAGDLLYNQVTNRLYVRRGQDIVVRDGQTDSVRTVLAVGSGYRMCFSPVTGRVYADVGSPDSIVVIDTSDGVAAWIPLLGSLSVSEMAFAPARNELYCGMSSDYVLVVDAGADTLVGYVDCTRFTATYLIHNPAGNKLYALCPSEDAVLVLAPGAPTARRLAMGIGNDAAVVLNPSLNRLYIAVDGWLWSIDCNTDVIVDSVPVPRTSHAVMVMCEDLHKLYVFPKVGSTSRAIWVYDCYRDSVVDSVPVSRNVAAAVYHPTTNRIYFKMTSYSSIGVLDPLLDSVVKEITVGTSQDHAWLVANPDRGVLYYVSGSTERIFSIDVLTDSVTMTDPLPHSIDTVYWNRRLDKLYVSNRAANGPTFVYDCRVDSIVRTLALGPNRLGLMNDRNDKLYLSDDTVSAVDCRTDSVVAEMAGVGAGVRAMAWNVIDNRVYSARHDLIAVYRDDPVGLAGEMQAAKVGLSLAANPVHGRARFRCQVPVGQTATLAIHDVLGRVVSRQFLAGHEKPVILTWAGTDARGRSVPAGIYFARLEAIGQRATVKVVLE